MVVVPENYKQPQFCTTCCKSIDDYEISILYKHRWYHAKCWLENKSIITKHRDDSLEELEIY